MILFAQKILFASDDKGDLFALDSSMEQTLQGTADLPPGDFGAAFLKMILSMVVLIVLMGATVWLLRRLIQNRLQKGSNSQSIQVIEKRMISPKTTLYIIEVDHQRIVIAESHLEIKKIHSLSGTAETT